jgi:hypothetical protein
MSSGLAIVEMIEEKRRGTSWRSIRLQPDLHKESTCSRRKRRRATAKEWTQPVPGLGNRGRGKDGKERNERRRKQISKKEGIVMDNAESV